MSVGNGWGEVAVVARLEWAAYDALPPQVRAVLRNAGRPWSARWVHDEMHKHKLTAATTAAALARQEAKAMGEDAWRMYGKAHPQAVYRRGLRRDPMAVAR